MTTSTFITVKGRRTRILLAGQPDNPPIVLLHGIGRSLDDWSPQFAPLAAGYRVIALDLPGFGFSTRPLEPITLPRLARCVAETLDALDERRPVHVIGNSMGGAVAMQLLVLQPHRVASLVLVNSAGFGREVSALLRMVTLPVIGRLATRRTTRASARLLERAIFADRSLASPQRIEHALAIGRQPASGAVMRNTATELATGRGVRPQWRADLAASVAEHPRPTLVVWGDRDRILPPHHLDSARKLMPHARTHLYTGIGHMPQIECPGEFSARVLDFLADVVGRNHSAADHRQPAHARN